MTFCAQNGQLRIVCAVFGYCVAKLHESSHSVRVFRRHFTEFEECAAAVLDGSNTEQGQDSFHVPSALSRRGIGNVHQRGNCVIFYFRGLPPDSLTEIVYSSDGYAGMVRLMVNNPHIDVSELRRLRNKWYYWVHDP